MSDDIVELDDYDVISFPKQVPRREVDGCVVVDYLDYEPPLTFPDLSSVGGIQVLKIFTNYLSGSLPDSITNLTSLWRLDLSCSTSKPGDGISSLPRNFSSLSQLEILNLCGNQFTGFPSCICELSNLKKLYLNGCRLTSVPSAISGLKCLEELDLSSNTLTSLPPEFFSLSELQELYLNNCGLEELLSEIGNLRKLLGLRLNNNHLKNFPEQFYELECLTKLTANHNDIEELSQKIEQLTSLEILCLMDNDLKELPKEIGKLRKLRYLNVSENKLTSIPEELTELSWKDFGFRVERNFNLLVPPLEICRCGLESIRGYYESIHADESGVVHSKRLKIVLLGESKAGKSSLAYALKHGRAPNILPDDRTIGIEFIMWKPNPEDPEGLLFQIVDCAGQRRYQLTHSFFLSEDALHMLVVNISKYEPTSECFKEMVGDWLDLVAAKIREPRIMVVPTHIDECTDASGAVDKNQVTAKCQDILVQIQRWQKENGDQLQKELDKRKKLSKKVLGGDENEECENLEKITAGKNQPPIISSMLCFDENMETKGKKPAMKKTSIYMVPISNKEGLQGLQNLKQEITRVAEDNKLFPLVGAKLPEKWLKLEKEISSYRENMLFPCVTYCQFAEFAKRQSGLMGQALLGAIRYWDTIGRLKYYDQIPNLKLNVVLDLKWLAKLMKLLFRHDYESNLQYRTEYLDKFGIDENWFSNDTGRLKHSAALSLGLLRCIWMEMQLDNEQFDQMVLLLKHFGLACELPTNTSNLPSPTVMSSPSSLLVPWFLHRECNQEVIDDWPDIPDESQVEIRLKFAPNYLPSGFFNRLRVRCHCCVDDYMNWYDGMMVFIGDIKILVSVCQSKPPSIMITGRNDKEKLRDLWRSMLLIVRETEHLLGEWRGINFRRYTICPHCVRNRVKKPWAFLCNWFGASTNHPGDHVERCKSTMRPTKVAVDLILPPQDVVKQFEGRSRLLLNPVSDEISDDLLSDLSQRLPLTWKQVGAKLGCTQIEMEVIEVDYRHVVERTWRMLRRWSQVKGSAAKRTALIRALVDADCTGEAEFVCNYSGNPTSSYGFNDM